MKSYRVFKLCRIFVLFRKFTCQMIVAVCRIICYILDGCDKTWNVESRRFRRKFDFEDRFVVPEGIDIEFIIKIVINETVASLFDLALMTVCFKKVIEVFLFRNFAFNFDSYTGTNRLFFSVEEGVIERITAHADSSFNATTVITKISLNDFVFRILSEACQLRDFRLLDEDFFLFLLLSYRNSF